MTDLAPAPIMDQNARERAQREVHRTLVVEAGAGTGKTTLLVERLLRLLDLNVPLSFLTEEGQRRATVPMREIAAITFTEKAAAELAQRLRDVLQQQLAASDTELAQRARDAISPLIASIADDNRCRLLGRSFAVTPEAVNAVAARSDAELAIRAREVLTSALYHLDQAQLTTIHAFCATLLRERPVEAGVDPNFATMDELQSRLLREEVWNLWLDDVMSGAEPHIAAAFDRDISLDRLHTFAFALLANRDLLAYLPERLDDIAACRRLTSELPTIAAYLNELLRSGTVDADDGLVPYMQLAIDLAQRMPGCDDVEACLATAAAYKPAKLGRTGNNKKWRDPTALARVRELLGVELPELVTQFVGAADHNLTIDVAESCRALIELYNAEKRRRGLLDFDDLLLLTRNMLRDSPQARRYAKNRFRALLIDEYQDTDPLQTEIAFYLAQTPGGDSLTDWHSLNLVPGKLFIVGDPKQSIYRFRRADIAIYQEAKLRITELTGDAPLHIQVNFRTVPGLIETVNGVFTEKMQASPDIGMQPEYVPLASHRDARGATPVTCLVPGPRTLAAWDEATSQSGGKNRPVDLARRHQAEAIASLITAMTENRGGAWMVTDKESGVERSPEPGDIALLFRTTTGLDIYEDCLREYGIPYLIEGSKRFYRRQEIQTVTALLRAIDNPTDTVGVVAALRSPALGVSNADLAAQRTANASFNYVSSRGATAAVDESFRLFRDLHARRNSVTASELLFDLYERTKLTELFALKPQGDQRVANLLKLTEMARALESAGQLSYHQFVRWVQDMERQEQEETESPLTTSVNQAVQIMTIHKAKGLEFPIVILPDLDGQISSVSPPLLKRRRTVMDGMELSLALSATLRTANYSDLKDAEERDLAAERVRLMYVAMTRARDHLVLPLHWRCKADAPRPMEALLDHLLPTLDTAVVQPPLRAITGDEIHRPSGQLRAFAVPLQIDGVDCGEVLQRREEFLSHRRQLADRSRQRRIVAHPSQTDRAAFTSVEPASEAAARGRDFGSLFHRIMETVDFRNTDALPALAAGFAGEFGLTPRDAAMAAALVRDALDGPVGERIRAANAVYREVPVVAREDGALIEGAADLVLVTADGLEIIDYKTDDVNAETLPDHVSVYRPQLLCYALALQEATAQRVTAAALYFARIGELVPVAITDDALEELHLSIREGRFATEQPPSA